MVELDKWMTDMTTRQWPFEGEAVGLQGPRYRTLWIKCTAMGFSIKGLLYLMAVNKGQVQSSSPVKRADWQISREQSGILQMFGRVHQLRNTAWAIESPKSWMNQCSQSNTSPGRSGTLLWKHTVIQKRHSTHTPTHWHMQTFTGTRNSKVKVKNDPQSCCQILRGVKSMEARQIGGLLLQML